jgi:hypothetical protein
MVYGGIGEGGARGEGCAGADSGEVRYVPVGEGAESLQGGSPMFPFGGGVPRGLLLFSSELEVQSPAGESEVVQSPGSGSEWE